MGVDVVQAAHWLTATSISVISLEKRLRAHYHEHRDGQYRAAAAVHPLHSERAHTLVLFDFMVVLRNVWRYLHPLIPPTGRCCATAACGLSQWLPILTLSRWRMARGTRCFRGPFGCAVFALELYISAEVIWILTQLASQSYFGREVTLPFLGPSHKFCPDLHVSTPIGWKLTLAGSQVKVSEEWKTQNTPNCLCCDDAQLIEISTSFYSDAFFTLHCVQPLQLFLGSAWWFVYHCDLCTAASSVSRSPCANCGANCSLLRSALLRSKGESFSSSVAPRVVMWVNWCTTGAQLASLSPQILELVLPLYIVSVLEWVFQCEPHG